MSTPIPMQTRGHKGFASSPPQIMPMIMSSDDARRRVWCFVQSKQGGVVRVKVSAGDEVGDVKVFIREKCKNGLLCDVDARDLTLWTVITSYVDPTAIADHFLAAQYSNRYNAGEHSRRAHPIARRRYFTIRPRTGGPYRKLCDPLSNSFRGSNSYHSDAPHGTTFSW